MEPLGVVPKDILFDIYKYFASKSVTNTCFSLEHTHLRNNNIIQKNERTWAVTISLRELDEKERVDSTPFMFKNVEFLIRVYWRYGISTSSNMLQKKARNGGTCLGRVFNFEH